MQERTKDKDIELATNVRFRSDHGVEIGKVVIIENGLYGILVKGVDGLFWRDSKALKVVIDKRRDQPLDQHQD